MWATHSHRGVVVYDGPMAHEHLEFLKHGERNFPPSGVGGVNVPSIIGFNNLNKFTTHDMNPKSHTEKLIDVVDYLQSLGPGEKVKSS